MRRLAALLLILTSLWLLYQTSDHFVGLPGNRVSTELGRSFTSPAFLLPLMGGLLGLAGGLIMFFRGAGGAAIAMIGGVVAAGFSLYIGRTLNADGLRFWESEVAVGVIMLALAVAAAFLGRD
jgi:hypothetical protein